MLSNRTTFCGLNGILAIFERIEILKWSQIFSDRFEQRIGIHDTSQCKLWRRQKSNLMKDSAVLVSSLASPVRLQICYATRERMTLPYYLYV